MNFFQRLRLAWRVLWYRGPWLPRYDFPDDPSLFDYPPDVVPSFPVPGLDREVKLAPVDTPTLRLVPRQVFRVPMQDWKPVTNHFEERV